MKLDELFAFDRPETIEESAKLVWAKKGNQVVKKFRCTSGRKEGRLVSNPSDCGGTVDMKKRQRMKITRKQKPRMAKKAQRTKKKNPASKTVGKLNKSMKDGGVKW